MKWYIIFLGFLLLGLIIGGIYFNKEQRGLQLTSFNNVSVEFLIDESKIILTEWNDEVRVGIKYNKSLGKGEVNLTDKKIKWKGTNEELHSYPLGAKEGMEKGGLEIEIVLKEKPLTNIFDFEITGAENLDFFYQPELTQEEIDLGSFRPENVVGSYAVYHKTKKDYIIGQTDYATGKLFHIYRPEVIDSMGNKIWGQLNYSNGVLSVTVSQGFLNNAVYPVIIDPTFGYTTIGASDSSTTDPIITKFTASAEDGNITKMSVYLDRQFGDSNVGAVIYSDSSGTPNSKLAEDTGNVLVTADAWYNLSISYLFTASQVLWLGSWTQTGGQAVAIHYDIGDTNQVLYSTGNTFETYPNPITGNYLAWKISIYATYTATAECWTNDGTLLVIPNGCVYEKTSGGLEVI